MRPLKVLQVDPALFTAPYDAALSRGLADAGATCTWATRPLRPGERSELDGEAKAEIFYRGRAALSAKMGGPGAKARKAASHLLSCRRLLRLVDLTQPDLVHLQWSVAPLLDAFWMRRVAKGRPLVFTVHDLQAFNHAATSRLQTLGLAGVMNAATALVVHTERARDALLRDGFGGPRVWVVPHGPLRFTQVADVQVERPAAGRWRLVLFGKLQPYKGVDVLLSALERLAPQDRAKLDVVVAGEPLMPMEAIAGRAAHLGVDLRPGRLDEQQAHALLASADSFVFPYRAIEASGVLYLVAGYRRWVIASDLGAFRDVIEPGINGSLIPAGDVEALAAALRESVGRRPERQAHRIAGWDEIGQMSRTLYDALLARRARRGRRAWPWATVSTPRWVGAARE